MNYVDKCTANSDVCVTGLLFGVILTLLLVWVYLAYFSKSSERMWGKKSERFSYPNQPTPSVQQLINLQAAVDPQYSRLATNALNQQAAGSGQERFSFNGGKEGFNFAKGA